MNKTLLEMCGVVLSLVCFVTSAGLASADPEKAPSLAGTSWSGTDSDGDDYVYLFEKDGTLAYKSPSGTYRNGKWKQSGNAVYFHMNDHYSEYLGEIKGDKIVGKAWNVTGHTWQWKGTRDKENP